jgi:hypothetical protein
VLPVGLDVFAFTAGVASYLASHWLRRRRRVRYGPEVKTLFPNSLQPVQLAYNLAREHGCTTTLNVRYKDGWAWWACQPTPGNDMLVTTGWCPTRRALERVLARAGETGLPMQTGLPPSS